MRKIIRIGLAGNPNSGKTTLFNKLTGARQHVGNYPGVTVEKKEGICKWNGHELHITDLPGAYSLTAYSIEEIVARDFLVHERPDVVVDVIDSSNLERNLYLAVQLMELEVPLVLAFNMADVAKARGIEFDLDLLSQLLGAPIVPTVGRNGKGLNDLVDIVAAVAEKNNGTAPFSVNYGPELEQELAKIQDLLGKANGRLAKYNPRWLAVKLFENDEDVKNKVESAEITAAVDVATTRLEESMGEHPDMCIAERRYAFISGVCQEAVRSSVEERYTRSDRIDNVVTNRVLALPIFIGMMYLTFHFTFTVGAWPMDWIDGAFERLGYMITGWWPQGTESALRSLLVDGIIGGVGGVIVFLPNIVLLFLAISLLEDSGYMARAAFIMDRLMHKIGLHGKSFIPMLLGFGCSVPAIMATRTLDNQRDRIATMLVVPLMSCGARLPIYALIIPAFFPKQLHAPMLLIIYFTGITLAVIGAKILRITFFRGESQPFVMELPPYRIPTIRATLTHIAERSWLYCKKAGTIILGISILMWVMTSYPKKTHFDRDYEAERGAAETVFLREVKGLNTRIGLPADSDLLTKAILSEQEILAQQGNEYESGVVSAQAERDATVTAVTQGPGAASVALFLGVRDKVIQARSNFYISVNEMELEKGTPDYATLENKHYGTIAATMGADLTILATVIRFLDDSKTPFDEKLEALAEAQAAEELAYSVSGRIGHAIEPLLKPMGFDWRIGTALIGALAAKEVFVAQMGIVFAVGETDQSSEALRVQLRNSYSPLVAFCIMLFCLISAPCMATIAVTRRESNSWKWALFQMGSLTVLAYILTVIVYQSGTLLGIGV